MKRDKDNPIDWSAFDETRIPSRTLKRNRLLAAVAALLFVVAVVYCAFGCMGLASAFAEVNLDDTSGTLHVMQTQVLRAALTLAFGLLTFFPAAVALQYSSRPDRIVMPVALGMLGMLSTAGAYAVGLGPEQFADARWLVLTLLALLYVAASFFVFVRARSAGSLRVDAVTGAYSADGKLKPPPASKRHRTGAHTKR